VAQVTFHSALLESTTAPRVTWQHMLRYLQGGLGDKFDALYLAGERSDPDTVMWAREQLDVPVIDHYWQTESGCTFSRFLLCVSCPRLRLGNVA